MARLGEPYVEKMTLKYLRGHYSSRYETKMVFAKTQAYTVSKYNGIADGFLCLHSHHQKFHSVSIEAKSHKTLMNLKPFVNYDRLILHVFLTAVIIGFCVAVFNWELKWYWLLSLFIGISIVSFLIMGLILDKSEPEKYKTADVVSQVSRYPANEKWIAISSDSINLLKKRKSYIRGCSYNNLHRICKRKGIGLVTVNHVNTKIILHPKFRKGDFLSCYKFKDEVEEYFSSNLLDEQRA